MWLMSALIGVFLPFIILGVFYMFSTKTLSDREKLSPFECGFDPVKSARQPFSLRFFLLAVIFLVFDVEIVLLLPVVVESNLMISFSGFIFLIILLVGLLHEWREGSLDWSLT